MSQSQTGTGNKNMPRSRQAETDRGGPPETLGSPGQGQVDQGMFMACLGDGLFMEQPGRDRLSPRSLGLDHTEQM